MPDKKDRIQNLNIDRNQIFAELGFGISDDILMMELKTTELQKQVTLLIAGKGRLRKKLRIGFGGGAFAIFDKNTEIDMDADEDEIIQQILNSKTTVEGKKVIAVDETSYFSKK